MNSIIKNVIFENYIYKYNEYLKYIDKKNITTINNINTINNMQNIIKEFESQIINLRNQNQIIDMYNIKYPVNEQLNLLKEQIYCTKWSKLNLEKKQNRIYIFLQKNNLESNFNNIIDLYLNKKITSKHINYDESSGFITNIINLDKYII